MSNIQASRRDENCEVIEQPSVQNSWRKYHFNIIDGLTEISPEWRRMLKGHDLETERYYSKENVEALREIYRKLWSDTAAPAENEGHIRNLEERVAQYEQAMEAILNGKISVEHIKHA